MSSQHAFLARVRRALHRHDDLSTSQPPLLWRDQDLAEAAAALQVRLAEQRPALISKIQEELPAVSGTATHVHAATEAVQYVTRLAQEKAARLVVRWQSDLLETLEVDAALQQQGVTVHTTALPTGPRSGSPPSAEQMTAQRQTFRELLARADLGLSGVDYVIAETGTLVLSSLAGQMRGVSLLPPVHVAVARTSQVLATLADYLLLTQAAGTDLQEQLTSCVSFVTGPRRTADIELTLAVRVHCPGELHLVLVEDPPVNRRASGRSRLVRRRRGKEDSGG